jgi:hypothetical protein
MDREVQLSYELIKSVSDKFSLDIVFILDLAGAGIREICNLELCVNLLHLNLSHNKILKIRGLQTCVELVFVDLSFNQISKIEGFRGLNKLERLDLSSNKITSLSGIAEFQSMPKLRCLSFQGFDFQDSNPVCRDSEYRSSIYATLPNLVSLDGHRKKVGVLAPEDFSKYEMSLKGVKLNMDNKPWVQPFPVLEGKVGLDDNELKSMIRECKSLLAKGDGILGGVK